MKEARNVRLEENKNCEGQYKLYTINSEDS